MRSPPLHLREIVTVNRGTPWWAALTYKVQRHCSGNMVNFVTSKRRCKMVSWTAVDIQIRHQEPCMFSIVSFQHWRERYRSPNVRKALCPACLGSSNRWYKKRRKKIILGEDLCSIWSGQVGAYHPRLRSWLRSVGTGGVRYSGSPNCSRVHRVYLPGCVVTMVTV